MARTMDLRDKFEECLDLQLQRLKTDLLLCHAQEVRTAHEKNVKQQELLPHRGEDGGVVQAQKKTPTPAELEVKETTCPKSTGNTVNLAPSSMNKQKCHAQERDAGHFTVAEGELRDKVRQASYQMSKVDSFQPAWRSWVVQVVDHTENSMKHNYTEMLQDFRNRHGLSEKKGLEHSLASIVDSLWFAVLSMLLICLNAAWMGVECNHIFEPEVHWYAAVNMVFCSAFALELVLRVAAFRCKFFLGPDCAWNLFDTLVVITSIPEYFGSAFNTTYLRLLRLVKLSRIFHFARLLKFLSSMHEILLTIFYTSETLCWVLVALIMVTYCFALLILKMIRSHIQDGGELSPHTMERFESTWIALLTLFTFITGGQEWYEIYMDFRQNQAVLAQYSLLVYIFFFLFGFFNVVTGVFCARANEANLECEELRKAAQDKRRAKQVHEILQLFRLIDVDCRDCISWNQFQGFAETTQGMEMLQAHGLQQFDLDNIWYAMDSYDGEVDNFVDKPAFVMGIMRLSPDAMHTSLFSLVVQIDKLRHDMMASLRILESNRVAISPPVRVSM